MFLFLLPQGMVRRRSVVSLSPLSSVSETEGGAFQRRSSGKEVDGWIPTGVCVFREEAARRYYTAVDAPCEIDATCD